MNMKKNRFMFLMSMILLFVVWFSSTVFAQTFYTWRQRTHATNCQALTDGKAQDLCKQLSDGALYVCLPSAGDCDTTGEWIAVGSGSGGTSGWTDSSTNVRLTTTTDEVIIGGTTPISSAKFSIDGDADQIQAIIQGNSSQTANLLTIENSAGTDFFDVDSSGKVIVNTTGGSGTTMMDFQLNGTSQMSIANLLGFIGVTYPTAYPTFLLSSNLLTGFLSNGNIQDFGIYGTTVSFSGYLGCGYLSTNIGGVQTCNAATPVSNVLTSAHILVGNSSNVATDVAMSGDIAIDNAGATTVQANAVALGTDTTGNYVASITTAKETGLATAGSCSSEGCSSTLAFDYTQTAASNPAMAARAVIPGQNMFIFEGNTADNNETQLFATDPVSAGDVTITMPARTGTMVLSGDTISGDVAVTFGTTGSQTATIQPDAVALGADTTGNYAAGDAEAGAALTGDSATSFFGAGQLEASRGGTGDDTSATTGIARIDSGNWTYSELSGDVVTSGSNAATIQANSVALGTDTTGNYALGDAEGGAATTGDSATAFFSAGTIELARGGTGASLVDPNADRFLFWDDSAGNVDFLTPGNGVNISGTTVTTTHFDPSTATSFFDDFTGNSSTIGEYSWSSQASGTGAAVTNISGEANHPGIRQCATGTTATGYCGWNNKVAGMACNGGDVSQMLIRFSSNTGVIWRGGLGDTTTNAESVDGYYFEFDTTVSPNWRIVTSNNSSRTKTTTSTAVAANTWYKLKVVVNAANTSVEYFVNDVSVGTITTNIPTSARTIGISGILANDGTATTSVNWDWDYIYFYNESISR